MPSKSRPAATDPAEEMKSTDIAEVAEDEANTGDVKVATSDGTGTKGSDDADAPASTDWWRFTGAYPCAYTTPDRVSQWIQPGQIVAWPDGTPDTNWEPVPEPEPAPSVSDKTTEE